MGLLKKYVNLAEYAGQRIDKALVLMEPTLTRQYIQKLIEEGHIQINDRKIKSSYTLKSNDKLKVYLPAPKSLELQPKQIKLDIVYEDGDILVVNKVAGMVVHPGNGGAHSEDSLVNAVLYHCGKDLSGIGGVARPGIVHRLDKDTSGLLIVAKTDLAHQALVKQFKSHQVEKRYYALVCGEIKERAGLIEGAIARASSDRKKMMVSNSNIAKPAKTKFHVLKHFELQENQDLSSQFTFCDIELLTGRTHQIRVHFQSINHPLIGDQTYGNARLNKLFEREFSLKRQFLHAYSLKFIHPTMGKMLEWKSDLPQDLENVLEVLRKK